MNIGIELTKLQIENLKNGASKFIIPISDYDLNRIKLGYSIGDSLPIYHTDKNKFFFIQEDFYQNENIYYKVDGWGDHLLYQNASEMKEELSQKLQEFASYTDNLEEVFENREQIEISKYYERLP